MLSKEEARDASEWERKIQKAVTSKTYGFEEIEPTKPAVRVFDTGANRDVDIGKHDPEGFLSPLVIDRYNAYMHKNRHLRDGSMRDSDNWQKGIPLAVYMKSMWRHFLQVWKNHRGYKTEEDVEEALCAMMFNTMGYLHEKLRERQSS